MSDDATEVASLKAQLERLEAQVAVLRNALIHGVIYASSQPASLRPLSAEERELLHDMAEDARRKFEHEVFDQDVFLSASEPTDAG